MTQAPSPQQLELASRVLSRRRLLPFVQRLNPLYLAGWVHEDICRRLEKFSDDVAKGLSPRLMLLCPPRSGKSELASRSFPAWHLGRNPRHEIIACSYNVSLAMTFSKKVKEVLQDPTFHPVFDIRLDPNNQSAEEWALDRSIDRSHAGGYVAAGVGGGITGKGCFSLDTTVQTRRGIIPMCQLQVGDFVLAYDHETEQPIFAPILAVHAARHAVGTGTYNGVRCTSDHPIYSPATKRYHPAASIKQQGLPVLRGAEVREFEGVHDVQAGSVPALSDSTGVPAMRRTESDTRAGMCGVLPEVAQLNDRYDMRAVSQVVQSASRRSCQEGPQVCTHVLLQGLRTDVPGAAETTRGVRPLWFGANPQGPESVLWARMLRRAQAWVEHLCVWARQGVQRCVPTPEAAGVGAGWSDMRYDGRQEGAGGSPHRPQPRKQPDGQPDYLVESGARAVSRYAGCTAEQLAAHVQRTGGEPHVVVDIQTSTGNFFADGVLAHNCHILVVDDPVKNAEEIDSADFRAKLMDWYGSTAYTRLAPGGGVLLVQTCWHDSDLAGQLQSAMSDPEADQFQIIKYPAIAEHDEYLDHASDLIVYEPPEGPHTLLRLKGEALHPERYDLAKLNQIRRTISPRFWSALYQQNPVPDDGAYFTKDTFRRAEPPHTSKCSVYIAWDFAISEKKTNDYTVGTVLLHDEHDVLHVADQMRFKSGDAFFIVEAILNLCERWYSPSLSVGFEDGQIYRAIEALLKKRMRERRVYPSLQVLKPITDKLARARPLQGRMQQGMVSFSSAGEWFDACRQEMLRFPAGAHDDMVDSLSWAVQMAIGRQPPRGTTVKPQKSWRDRINHTGSGSFMSA